MYLRDYCRDYLIIVGFKLSDLIICKGEELCFLISFMGPLPRISEIKLGPLREATLFLISSCVVNKLFKRFILLKMVKFVIVVQFITILLNIVYIF